MRPHVLAARLDSAGDVLLMGPAIRALSAGAGKVTLLCGPRGLDAAELLPGIEQIVVHEAAWIDAGPGPLDTEATLSLVKELASREIDEAVIFTSFHQSPLPLALLLRMAGVGRIAAVCEDHPGSLLDIRHRVAGDIHEVERALSLVRAAGYELPGSDDGRLRLKPLPEPDAAFRVRLPYVVVHPGASVPARAWAPDRHAALVKRLAEGGTDVVVTGGPSDVDLTRLVSGLPPAVRSGSGARRTDHPAAKGATHVQNLGGKLTLRELAILLKHADAAVVANTGPAHLSAAVRTPVVSLFAPTVPAVRWRPWKVPHILLGNQEIACAGCRARVCPVPGHPCIDEVAIEDVMAALNALIGTA